MNLDDFQKEACGVGQSDLDDERLLAGWGLGLGGEAGEIQEHIKKHVLYGKSLPVAKLHEELGDLLWYVAAVSDLLGFDLSSVARANIRKLHARYPNGFSQADALARKDEVL
jgi:NTP pyrophosphatase (non-canonical NTP hydrolase)